MTKGEARRGAGGWRVPDLCQLSPNFPRTAVGNQALSIPLRWDGECTFFVTHALIRASLNSWPKEQLLYSFLFLFSFFLSFAKKPGLYWTPSNTSANLNFGRRKKINCT